MPFEIHSSSLREPDDESTGENFHSAPEASIFGSDEFGVSNVKGRENATPLPPANRHAELLTKPYEDLEEIARKKFRERRGTDRLGGKFPVTISVVFPQETFTPFIEETHIMNLTTRGAMGRVNMPEAVLQRVLREVHYCRLQFNMDTLPQRILGQVRWYAPIAGERSTFRIGVRFDNLTDYDLVKLSAFVNLVVPDGEKANPASQTVNVLPNV